MTLKCVVSREPRTKSSPVESKTKSEDLADSLEFDLDRRIDPMQLDIECIRQSDIFFKWAERSIEAKSRVDRLKARSDTVLVEIQVKCRANPRRFGLSRVSDASVRSVAQNHSKYKAACDDCAKAREESMWLERAVAALEMKKRMLECLITLHGQKYFAVPSTPRMLDSSWEEKQVEQEVALVDKQRKRKRKRA